jgi:hypothetical protein
MPQDIPVEASETLSFTPECLADIDNPPKFTLRAATERDKRFHRRLYTEEGLRRHSQADLRAEILNGLKALWTEEQFDEHAPILQEWWDAGDSFAEQRREDPDVQWEYDPAVEKACKGLTDRVVESHAPLRRMIADNMEWDSMSDTLLAAVVVKSWTGLDVRRELDRGYVTVDCITAVREALSTLEETADPKVKPGTAWAELAFACVRRFYLSEEEAGNSESQSPSTTAPEASSETTTSAKAGKSPASASSAKTPVDA